VTQRVVLIGKPLKRKHSAVMHNAAFAAAGIDATYEAMELEPDEVATFVARVRDEAGWLGMQVTAPYKKVVAGLVDEVEPDAQSIGAVNSVAKTADGRLVGFNTDSPGFRIAVTQALGRPLQGIDAVVAGAGGAAHAVVFALQRAGVRRLTVGNRSLPASVVGQPAIPLDGADFQAAVRSADLAVNATSVGMIDAGTTIPVDLLPAHATVFDLVYVPPMTPLLAAARARGLRAANGEEMLVAQAAIAFERWTGVGGMANVMRAAAAPLFADAAAHA
jgi:shikimate dehydrogenase